MRIVLCTLGSLAATLAITASSQSGIHFQTVTPGTSQDRFQVSVEAVSDDGARTRAPASPSPGWGTQAYRLRVTGDFSNVAPNAVGGSVRIVAGGRLLATASLQPRWKDGRATFEVTVSDSLVEESELNVARAYDGPAADIWIFPIGEYLKSAK